MHSPTDNLVGIDNARRVYEAARHPKSFVALDGADHLLTRVEDAEYVADVIAAWVRRCLPDSRTDAHSRRVGDPGVVIVEDSGDGRYAQQVTGTTSSSQRRPGARKLIDHGQCLRLSSRFVLYGRRWS